LFGFPPDDSKDLGLRERKAHIVLDAEEHCPRATPLLYDQRSALILDTTEKLAEIGPRVEGSDDNSIVHKLSSLTD